MPITPRFNLQQTSTHILLDVFVPHIRVTAVEVVVEEENNEDRRGSIVHVSASPVYLLVLNLAPYQLVVDHDDESNEAAIEPIHGTVHIKLEKLHAGQHWENLDLIGALVQPRTNAKTARNCNGRIMVDSESTPTSSRWLREVVGTADSLAHILPDQQEDDSAAEEFDEIDQRATHKQQSIMETLCNTTRELNASGYGFARLFHGVFTDLVRDGLAQEMLEGHDAVANTVIVRERRRGRIAVENSKFCAVRYLGDSMHVIIEDDYLYQCAVTMQPHWMTAISSVHDGNNDLSCSFFTPEERLQLQSIPYPLMDYAQLNTQQLREPLMAGLVDLLFAYVYDHLLTQGDPTVESAWTVSTLSASLSWLDDWIAADDDENGSQNRISLQELVQSVVRSSLRRALIYPYLRNYEFAVQDVFGRHVVALLRAGLRPILRGLLQMRRILHNSELYYLGNKLYVDPYLAWLQKTAAADLDWNAVADAVEACLQDKHNLKVSLGLDLIRIEASVLEDDDDHDDNLSSGDGESSSDDENSSEDDDTTIDKLSFSSNSTAEAVDATIQKEDQDEDRISRDLLNLDLGTSEKEASASNNPIDLFRVVLQPTGTTVEDAEEEEPGTRNRQPLIEELS